VSFRIFHMVITVSTTGPSMSRLVSDSVFDPWLFGTDPDHIFCGVFLVERCRGSVKLFVTYIKKT
jgi:hypothetical protein